MVRRSAREAIGEQVDESVRQPAGLESNLDSVRREWLNWNHRHHAHRDERTIRTVFILLSLCVRTARHVAGHRRHITHLADRQPFGRSRYCQRRSNEPNDDKDRQQTTDESAKIHNLISHRKGRLGKVYHFTWLLDHRTRPKASKIHTVNSSRVTGSRAGELSLGGRYPNRQTPSLVAP
jgi:hypothetical protein